MGELFGLEISEGAIANALRRANRPLDAADAAITQRLREAPVIGDDETGARVTTDALGTRMAWKWVLVSATAVLHRIDTSRGRDVITRVLAGHRPRCWGSDRWGAQQGHADTQQLCLAHVLRDVQYAVDAGETAFAPTVRKLLCWAIRVGRRRPTLKDSPLAQYYAPVLCSSTMLKPSTDSIACSRCPPSLRPGPSCSVRSSGGAGSSSSS